MNASGLNCATKRGDPAWETDRARRVTERVLRPTALYGRGLQTSLLATTILVAAIACRVSDGVSRLSGCLVAASAESAQTSRVGDVVCELGPPVILIALPPQGATVEQLVDEHVPLELARLVQESSLAGSRWCTGSQMPPPGTSPSSGTPTDSRVKVRCVESSFAIERLRVVSDVSSVKVSVKRIGERTEVTEVTKIR